MFTSRVPAAYRHEYRRFGGLAGSGPVLGGDAPGLVGGIVNSFLLLEVGDELEAVVGVEGG